MTKLDQLTEEEMKKELTALANYFDSRKLSPAKSYVLMEILQVQINEKIGPIAISGDGPCENPDCKVHGKH